ncbi:MAG TPA: PKD domain-containing protein, partial [Anaerolineae bacterium]|nr:PKD domain-containing protein [Anaerolineae bacterium]
TRHKPEEGDADLPIINPGGSNVADDHQQGPDLFVNGESAANTNIVLWYVPQHGTDRRSDDGTPPYCWTVAGEPNPETYPCYGGPLFVPFGVGVTGSTTASFVVNGSEFGVADTAVFTNTSTLPDPNIPANFLWNFGDGVTTGSPLTATHRYLLGGVFTPTLTVDAFAWGMDTAVGQPITATAKNNFLPLIKNGE